MSIRTSYAVTAIIAAAIAGGAVCQLGGCGNLTDDNGDNGGSGISDNGDGGAPLLFNNNYRHIQLGINDDDAWVTHLLGEVDEPSAGQFQLTFQRSSAGQPPVGTELAPGYTEESDQTLTFSSDQPPLSADGRLNSDGTTYLIADSTLDGSDGEGTLNLGIQTGTGRGESLLDGDYFVATAYSPNEEGPNFYTGYFDMAFDGAGNISSASLTTAASSYGQEFAGPGSYEMLADEEGFFFIKDPDESAHIGNIVRYDGKLFAGTHDLYPGSGDNYDNSRKGVFIGVKKSSNATDALLAGTYDMRYLCSSNNNTGSSPDGWDEGKGTITLDANGDGTWSGGGETAPLSIDLETDGTFQISSWNNEGAVTPSGEVMVMANTSTFDGVYCLTVGIKQP
jgi:hypothetical protein